MLKSVFETKEQAPESIREHLSEKDGKFYLTVDGMVPASEHNSIKARVNEFRDNNTQLLKDKTELTDKLKHYDGIDPDEHRRLKSENAELATKGIKKPDDLTAAIEAAMQPYKKRLDDTEKKLQDAEKSKRESETRLAQRDLMTAIGKGLSPRIREDVLDDAVARAMNAGFAMQNGALVLLRNGQIVYSNDSPDKAMTIEEWSTTGIPAPFKKENRGGGATGQGDDKTRGGSVKVLKNPTPLEMGRHAADIAAGKIVVERK